MVGMNTLCEKNENNMYFSQQKYALIIDVAVIVSEDDDNVVRCDDRIVTKMKPDFLNSPLIQVIHTVYVLFS